MTAAHHNRAFRILLHSFHSDLHLLLYFPVLHKSINYFSIYLLQTVFTNSHPSRVLSFLPLNMKSTFSINVSFFFTGRGRCLGTMSTNFLQCFQYIYIKKKNCTSFADLCKLVFSYRTRIRNHHVLCHWSHPVQDSGPHLTRTNVGSSSFFYPFNFLYIPMNSSCEFIFFPYVPFMHIFCLFWILNNTSLHFSKSFLSFL